MTRRFRSVLFVPGGRADMIAKAPRCNPDVIVVDLEDAVAGQDKELARLAAVEAIAALSASPATTVLVRVNPVGSPWFNADVAASSGGAGVVLPKLERSSDLDMLAAGLADRPDAVVVVGLETARGVADARPLLAACAERGVAAVYFGAEDYVADLGGRRSPLGHEVLYARSHVCLAARLAGVWPVDQAVVAVADDERYRADAADGAALGYAGKLCVHPRQVALAHAAFTPSADDVAHAHAVLAAAAGGASVVDGEMVDAVHVKLARRVLDQANEP